MNHDQERLLRVLWVTNDLPPRHGGIESFIGELLQRTFLTTTHVFGPKGPKDAPAFDAAQPYTVERRDGRVLPTPATFCAVCAAARRHNADVIILGALWPLGELAGRLTRTLNVPVIALSHGHEAGLMHVGGSPLIRRATKHLAGLTTIASFTQQQLSGANRAANTARIPPGVDINRFTLTPQPRPAVLASIPADAPIVGGLSRLVARKGFDRLLDAWPAIQAAHPNAWLVLAGDGPDRKRLTRRAEKRNVTQVLFTGGVARDDLPALYKSFAVFAAPVRTRNFGLDVEGLGIVFLEAQACGVPLVVGCSGGAPETVLSDSYGTVVDGTNPQAIARAVSDWLADPHRRTLAKDAARQAACDHWSWEQIAARFVVFVSDVTLQFDTAKA